MSCITELSGYLFASTTKRTTESQIRCSFALQGFASKAISRSTMVGRAAIQGAMPAGGSERNPPDWPQSGQTVGIVIVLDLYLQDVPQVIDRTGVFLVVVAEIIIFHRPTICFGGDPQDDGGFLWWDFQQHDHRDGPVGQHGQFDLFVLYFEMIRIGAGRHNGVVLGGFTPFRSNQPSESRASTWSSSCCSLRLTCM